MATTPATPPAGPLEKSLAQTAGADAQAVVDQGTIYAQEAITATHKGVAAAQQGVTGAAATIETMAAKAQASLDEFKLHSAAGAVGSRVQNAIEHLTALIDMARGFLFSHKAAAGIPQEQSTTNEVVSQTANMPPPTAASVPTAASGVAVSNVQAEQTNHLPVKSDVTSKV